MKSAIAVTALLASVFTLITAAAAVLQLLSSGKSKGVYEPDWADFGQPRSRR